MGKAGRPITDRPLSPNHGAPRYPTAELPKHQHHPTGLIDQEGTSNGKSKALSTFPPFRSRFVPGSCFLVHTDQRSRSSILPAARAPRPRCPRPPCTTGCRAVHSRTLPFPPQHHAQYDHTTCFDFVTSRRPTLASSSRRRILQPLFFSRAMIDVVRRKK